MSRVADIVDGNDKNGCIVDFTVRESNHKPGNTLETTYFRTDSVQLGNAALRLEQR